jgi:hypothetical protein
MDKRYKKAAIVLVGVLVLSLVVGNTLFASDDYEPGVGLLSESDVSFVSSGFNESASSSGRGYSESFSGLVATQDLEFVSQPFSRDRMPSSGTVYSEYTGPGIVHEADINFVRNGVFGSDLSNLVCVVNGVQVTGQACVN